MYTGTRHAARPRTRCVAALARVDGTPTGLPRGSSRGRRAGSPRRAGNRSPATATKLRRHPPKEIALSVSNYEIPPTSKLQARPNVRARGPRARCRRPSCDAHLLELLAHLCRDALLAKTAGMGMRSESNQR